MTQFVSLALILVLSNVTFAQNKPSAGRAVENARRNIERSGREARTAEGGYETGVSRVQRVREQSVDPKLAAEINKLTAEKIEFLSEKSENVVLALNTALKLTGMTLLKENLETFRKSETGKKEEYKETYENIYEIILTLGQLKGGSESEALVMDFMTRHAPVMLKEFSEGKLENFTKLNNFINNLATSVKGTSTITEDQLTEALVKSEINKEDFKNLCGR